MLNLDFHCMRTAQQMVATDDDAGDKETVARNGLHVLLANGPYGFLLFLQTRGGTQREIARHYQNCLVNMCNNQDTLRAYFNAEPAADEFSARTDWLGTIAQNLDTYLFLKGLWQQTLTYARFHAKATTSGTEQPDAQTAGDQQPDESAIEEPV